MRDNQTPVADKLERPLAPNGTSGAFAPLPGVLRRRVPSMRAGLRAGTVARKAAVVIPVVALRAVP